MQKAQGPGLCKCGRSTLSDSYPSSLPTLSLMALHPLSIPSPVPKEELTANPCFQPLSHHKGPCLLTSLALSLSYDFTAPVLWPPHVKS